MITRFGEYLKEFDQVNISIVTYYEIIAGLKFKKAERQLQDVEGSINDNNIINISEESAKISGDMTNLKPGPTEISG